MSRLLDEILADVADGKYMSNTTQNKDVRALVEEAFNAGRSLHVSALIKAAVEDRQDWDSKNDSPPEFGPHRATYHATEPFLPTPEPAHAMSPIEEKVYAAINMYQDMASWLPGDNRNKLVCEIRDTAVAAVRSAEEA